ncbi:chlorophyll a-b binding protein, chloroplastic, partial [Haematococcus lacustris]
MQLSMKAATSRAGACRFAGRKVSSASNGSRVMMKAGNWLPGSETPSWLAEDIPGNYGFDPVGLGRDSETLMRFREAELIHCRWAMLGVAGCLAVEVLGYGNWYDAPNW